MSNSDCFCWYHTCDSVHVDKSSWLGCHNRLHTADCVWLCSQVYLCLEWKLWRVHGSFSVTVCVYVCVVQPSPGMSASVPLEKIDKDSQRKLQVHCQTADLYALWSFVCVISAAPAMFLLFMSHFSQCGTASQYLRHINNTGSARPSVEILQIDKFRSLKHIQTLQ